MPLRLNHARVDDTVRVTPRPLANLGSFIVTKPSPCRSCVVRPAPGRLHELASPEPRAHGTPTPLSAAQLLACSRAKTRPLRWEQGEARRGKARKGEARRGEAGQGWAWLGKARQGEARRGEARRGEAGQGWAGLGKAGQGVAWRIGFVPLSVSAD